MVQPTSAAPPGRCAYCNKTEGARFTCGKCREVTYCGSVCQVAHWKAGHKQACPELAAKRAAAVKQAAAEEDLEDEVAPLPTRVLYPYAKFLRFMQRGHVCAAEPVGLANCGNTCFANAVLQCLLHTTPLVAYLRSGAHTEACTKPKPSDFCLMCEMQRLVEQVRDAQDDGRLVVSPSNITRQLRRIATHFMQGRQEDAHELYCTMLGQLEGVLLHEALGNQRADMHTKETTLIGHCFTGYVSFQTICSSCNAISQRFDTKAALELVVSSATPTLEASLLNSFADEQLAGANAYACSKCKKEVTAVRRSCIEVAPNILVICLKRFRLGPYGKINSRMSYPVHLDLEPYRASDALDDAPCTYALYGVLVHLDVMNSTMSGHYVSYVKVEGGTWYLCNDSHTKQVVESEALSQNAYMLFYKRDQPRPAPDPSLKPSMQQRGVSHKTAPMHHADFKAAAAARQAGSHANGSMQYANGHHRAGVVVQEAGTSDSGAADGSCEGDAGNGPSSSMPHSVHAGNGVQGSQGENGQHDHDVQGVQGHGMPSSNGVGANGGVRSSSMANGRATTSSSGSSSDGDGDGGGGAHVLPNGLHQHQAAQEAAGAGGSKVQILDAQLPASSSSSAAGADAQGVVVVPRVHVQSWSVAELEGVVQFAGVELPVEQVTSVQQPECWLRASGSSTQAQHQEPQQQQGSSGDDGEEQEVTLVVALPGVSRAAEVQVAVHGEQVLVWVPGRYMLPCLPLKTIRQSSGGGGVARLLGCEFNTRSSKLHVRLASAEDGDVQEVYTTQGLCAAAQHTQHARPSSPTAAATDASCTVTVDSGAGGGGGGAGGAGGQSCPKPEVTTGSTAAAPPPGAGAGVGAGANGKQGSSKPAPAKHKKNKRR